MRTIIVHKTNSFRLGTTKKYAVLAFKEDGLKILCTNENPENFDTLVLALASRVGIIYLPTIVMQAYGLEREDYEVEIINENKFFIRRKRLFDISFENPLPWKKTRHTFWPKEQRTKTSGDTRCHLVRRKTLLPPNSGSICTSAKRITQKSFV